MRRSLLAIAAVASLMLPTLANAAPVIGKPAPAFSVKDATGKEVSLASLKGKIVVLEWSNFGCPFVKKFYSAGAMQSFQKAATKQDVVWLTIFSSAEGKEGHLAPAALSAEMAKQGGAPSHIIPDADGTFGKMYEAKTTPHMFVIDKEGTLAYMGAIDNKASVDSGDIKGATNYVNDAIAALAAGKPVTVSSTKPYGCGVKYAN
jgi:alkyl hydroperoxide reductase subunit AhpC